MSGAEITVRPVRADELEQAGHVTVTAYLTEEWVQPGDGYATELADTASRARDAELLVAVDGDGRVLGTVTVCGPDSPYAELCRPGELEFRMLAVDPAARGRGVGERLTTAVVDRARSLGRKRVVLCTAESNHVAQRIYRRLGFRRLPDRDWSPNERLTLVAYCYELD